MKPPSWKKAGPDGEVEIKFPTGRRFKVEKQYDHNIRHKGEWKVMEWDARTRDWEWADTYSPKAYAKEMAVKLGQYKNGKKVADYSATFKFESVREESNYRKYIEAMKKKTEKMNEAKMDCPAATQDLKLNTKNRDSTIKNFNYGPLNVDEPGDYWQKIANYWKTTETAAKKSLCGNCVAFDISPRMDECMPGETSDDDGRLGYCWMHHFKCHSARSCHTWAKGGPIKTDEKSYAWQERGEKKANESVNEEIHPEVVKAYKKTLDADDKASDYNYRSNKARVTRASNHLSKMINKHHPGLDMKGKIKLRTQLQKEDTTTASVAGAGDDNTVVVVDRRRRKDKPPVVLKRFRGFMKDPLAPKPEESYKKK